MSIKNDKKYFSTFETSLASYLVSIGFKVEEFKKDNFHPNKVHFCFNLSPQLEKATEDFWNDTALVNPQLFSYNNKALKNRIRSMS